MNTFYKVSHEIDKEIKKIKKDKINTNTRSNCSNSLPRLINKYEDYVSKVNDDLLFNKSLPLDEIQVRRKEKKIKFKKTTDEKDETEGNDKMNIIEKEKTLSLKLNKLLDIYNCLNERLNLLYSSIEEIKNKLKGIDLEVEFMENYEKFCSEKNKKIIQKIQNDVHLNKNEKEKQIQEKIIMLRQSQNKEFLKREAEIRRKLEEKESVMRDINEKYKLIHDCEKEIQGIKASIKGIKHSLLEYYHRILNKGEDVGAIGLIWIIIEIWKIKEKVKISEMPRYLDDKSVLFLLKYAEKYIKYLKLKKEYEDFQLKIRHKLNKNFQNTIDNVEDEKFKKIKYRQKENKQTKDKYKIVRISNINDGLINISHISKVISIKESNFSNEEKDFLSNRKDLNFELNLLKTEIEEMVDSQAKRIYREFMNNDYERRFNASIQVVLKGLFGEERVYFLLTRYNLERKKYIHDMKETRMYYDNTNSCINIRFNVSKQENNHVIDDKFDKIIS